jgi:hypothetical protein
MEIAPMPTPFSSAALAYLQASFVANVLPRVLSHGRVYFRGIKCQYRREDALQEMISLAWQWHLRLAEKGKDASRFPSAIACYVTRALQSGRRLGDQERATKGLAPLDQQGHHFAVGTLPDDETLSDDPASETRPNDTTSPAEETLGFQRDFAAWLASVTEQNRGIAEDLLGGEPTRDVADKYGLSPARLAQLRSAFCQDWRAFCHQLSALAASSALDVA